MSTTLTTVITLPCVPVTIQKDIDSNNYNHNFTLIDGVPYGPDYRVEFPFATARPMPINDLAWFRAYVVEVERPLDKNSLWMPFLERDGPIIRIVLRAVERAVCPEPFISLTG